MEEATKFQHISRKFGFSQPATEQNLAKSLSKKRDRKSTRLNSSHANISYAVFCLKKKNTKSREHQQRPDPTLPTQQEP